MIVYEATKSKFLEEFLNQTLIDNLCMRYRETVGKVKDAELKSWQNSLMFMYQVLEDQGIPNNTGVSLEYKIPFTNNRIDMILSGYRNLDENCVVVIELKQWTMIEQNSDKVGYVVTVLGGGKNLTEHPSYQAWSYAYMLKNYNKAVAENNFIVQPCAFLHNYKLENSDALLDEKYQTYIDEAPVFAKGDIKKLRDFIKNYIHYGDNKEGLYSIDKGQITPSKMLQDSLVKMLKGNNEFVLIDRQFSVYEKALYFAQQSYADKKKRVLIVKGGPGTGKSVVAINLLVNLMSKNKDNKIPLNTVYVTKNENPRNVYLEKLQGNYTKAYIKNIFKGSLGTFVNTEENTFDVIVCDEAHRLMKNSGRFFPNSNSQIEDIIRSASCGIFFINEYQKICMDDYGSIDNIIDVAKKENANFEIMELESQFRCNGSDGYLKWLEDVLDINSNANANDMGLDYLFNICDTPNQVFELIEKENRRNNKSRLVAGYCWNWIGSGKRNSNIYDIKISKHNFEKSWNIPTGTWAIDAGSVNQVGCIHTCQGLEFEYVGVIIGNDLRYENGQVITDFTARAKTDHSLNGIKKMYKDNPRQAIKVADEIIKNTYRVLMSRGMKGCFVYCEDEKLSRYLKQRLEKCEVNHYKLFTEKKEIDIDFNRRR